MLIDDLSNQTYFSLCDDAPQWIERPQPAQGSLEVLRGGWLIVEGCRRSCLIRTLTGGGAIVHSELMLRPGQLIALQLGSAGPMSASVEWADNFDAGLAFNSPADMVSIIAADIANQPDERRRMPRVGVHCLGRIGGGSANCPVTVRDISQGGVKVELEAGASLTTGEVVTLTMDGFRPIQSKVRWHEDGFAGVEFEAELAWQELMPWLKAQRDRAQLRRPQPATAEPAGTGGATADQKPESEEAVGLNISAMIREGTMRWSVEVVAISTTGVEFESFASPRVGTFLWVMLPGLEGWYAQIVSIERYRFTCRFVHPLHPLVLRRVVESARS